MSDPDTAGLERWVAWNRYCDSLPPPRTLTYADHPPRCPTHTVRDVSTPEQRERGELVFRCTVMVPLESVAITIVRDWGDVEPPVEPPL